MESASLHPLSLRFFSETTERAFQADYLRQSLGQMRLALLVGLALYALFGLLDPWMVPGALTEVLLIRAAVCAVVFLVWLLTFGPLFQRHAQLFSALVPLVAGLGVTVMVWVAQNAEGYYHYYVGLMLILFFVHVLLRMRFVYATVVSWVIIGAYEAVTLWLATTPLPLLVNNTFFLCGANISGMFASYMLERYARQIFWQRQVLDEKLCQLEAEHARKTKELEAARRLQLSLLPQRLPEHPLVDLAAYTKGATEISGDYYDFDVSADGTLTFAIGDATGHGAQTSAMVTATKILFTSLVGEPDVVQILKKATLTLKRVGLSHLYMALAVGRLRGPVLELAGAGMPPALLYRAASTSLEQISLKGMPLGSFPTYPYQTLRLVLAPGDTVVLMSDGFPELFNLQGDSPGYDYAADILQSVANCTPNEIIAQLVQACAAWTNGHPQSDDITFVVVKMKAEVPSDRPVSSHSKLTDYLVEPLIPLQGSRAVTTRDDRSACEVEALHATLLRQEG